jgi:Cu(I)/Ag(I) efflux system membrane fusion protein
MQSHAATIPAKVQVVEPVQHAPQVEISAEQQKLIGVKTVKVALRQVQKVIRTVGRIEADEGRQATINSKVEGWIEKLYVQTTGSHVQKGQPLAEIYSPELMATQQEFLTALKWKKELAAAKAEIKQGASPELSLMLNKDAEAMLAAARQRLLLWDVSEGQIKSIEESGKTIRTLTLYSPASGFITQKMAVSGMKVMPGEKLFDVADLSNLWVIADIYEAELALIKVGDKASITLAYLPGREISSQIDYIYPSITAETRAVKVRLKLSNHNNQLKPQMFTNVEIKINLGKKLMIPESAVIDTGKSIVAYVDSGNGAFEPREIKAGLRTDGYIEVLRGLKPGEKVVSAANFLVDSEAQMKGIKPLPK